MNAGYGGYKSITNDCRSCSYSKPPLAAEALDTMFLFIIRLQALINVGYACHKT